MSAEYGVRNTECGEEKMSRKATKGAERRVGRVGRLGQIGLVGLALMVCAGCATRPRLVQVRPLGANGQIDGAAAVVQWAVVEDPPLTSGEKWLRAGGIAAGAICAGLVLQNNEWGAFERENKHDEPAGNTYTIDAEQVNVVEDTGGNVTIDQEDNDQGE